MNKPIKLLALSLSIALLASCGGIAPQGSTESKSKEEASSSVVDSKKDDESLDSSEHLSDQDDSDLEKESEESVSGEESSVESVSDEDLSSSGEESEESSSGEDSSDEDSSSEDENDGFITTSDGVVSQSGNIYTISAAGTYDVSGTREGQIYVEAGDDDVVEINLNGVTLTYGENSPIYILNADKVEISAKSGTNNTITDSRSEKTADDDTQGNGAIYSKCDLKLKGKGTLTVNATYNNGIHSTKDLDVKNLTLNVTSYNNALKGNDSITVDSGAITLISTGGDGMKTEDTDISSSGNQRGTITINNGNITIYSACDGLDASYDAVINGGTMKILTNKYSSYTGEIASTSTTTMYLRTTASYSASYRYSVYFYGDSGNYSWSDATYKTSMTSGGGNNRKTYYYYELEKPANYDNFKVYKFTSSAENSTTDYIAATSKGNTCNSNYDTATLTESGNSISVSSWSNYGSNSQGGGPGGGGQGGGPGGADSGNSDKADSSAKGIKADNVVTVNGGVIDIKAYDDGIHANYGAAFDNGSSGLGDVTIAGGDITIYASDDGIHADRYLAISDGAINVTNSYEGLEGNQITISGGESYVYASDDGVNAGSGTDAARLNPLITVTGGYIFAAVPSSGDTDGFDSNGNIVISGGTVIACGPNQSFGASAFDADGSCSLSGSTTTLLIFGGSEATPSYSSSIITKSTKSGTYSSGKAYTVNYSSVSIVTGKLVSGYSSFTSYSGYGSVSSTSVVS